MYRILQITKRQPLQPRWILTILDNTQARFRTSWYHNNNIISQNRLYSGTMMFKAISKVYPKLRVDMPPNPTLLSSLDHEGLERELEEISIRVDNIYQQQQQQQQQQQEPTNTKAKEDKRWQRQEQMKYIDCIEQIADVNKRSCNLKVRKTNSKKSFSIYNKIMSIIRETEHLRGIMLIQGYWESTLQVNMLLNRIDSVWKMILVQAEKELPIRGLFTVERVVDICFVHAFSEQRTKPEAGKLYI